MQVKPILRASYATLLVAVIAFPASADEQQDIGIVKSIDRVNETFVCDCASNTLADMSHAKRSPATYKTTAATTYSAEQPFPKSEKVAAYADLKSGKSVIVEYHFAGKVRVLDTVTIDNEDCRPKFCGP